MDDHQKRLAEVRAKIFSESELIGRARARRDYWKRVKKAIVDKFGLEAEGQLDMLGGEDGTISRESEMPVCAPRGESEALVNLEGRDEDSLSLGQRASDESRHTLPQNEGRVDGGSDANGSTHRAQSNGESET